MAFATVVDHQSPNSHPNHIHLESLPLIDLRLLSQSDLYSLSLTSFSPLSHPTRRFDDDVLIPKIDRSVFNESAGSRKQTYSRLRLAPRNSQFPIPNPKSQTTPHSHFQSQSRDPETLQIIHLLKQLFPSDKISDQNNDDDDMVSGTVSLAQDHDYTPGPSVQSFPFGLVSDNCTKRKRGRPRKDSSVVMAYPMVDADVSVEKRGGDDTTPDIVVGSSDGKRKRGRPRKDEIRLVSMSKHEKKASVKEPRFKEDKVKEEAAELVKVNGNGVFVDFDALGNADNLFDGELRKRTEGMKTEAQLLEFLGGMEGEWSSARKKRKVVQASQLGDALPMHWKILLALKRNGGHVWLFCRRYISPNGQQFVSCKEVSSYLVSYFGVGNQSNPGLTGDSNQLSSKIVSGDGVQVDTNLTFERESKADELVSCSPLPTMSVSTDQVKQEAFLHTEKSQDIQPGEVIGMPKNYDTEKTGLLTSLNIHESVQLDGEVTLDAIANYESTSGNEGVKNCFGTYNCESISSSCEEQALKAKTNGKDTGFSEKGSSFNFTIDKLEKADEAIVVGVSTSDTNAFGSFPDGINDGFKASVSSVDVPKMDADTAVNSIGKESRTGNIDNNQLTSTVENTEVDNVDDFGNGRSMSDISENSIGPEDYTNVKQQSTSEACSLVSSLHSQQERGSEEGFCSMSNDVKTCDVSNNFNSESFQTSYDPKFGNMDTLGNDERTITFGSDHVMPDVDAMEIGERVVSTGSCSNVPALDGQSSIALSNAKNLSCSVEELWQEKSFQRNLSAPFIKQDTVSSETATVYPSGYTRRFDLVNKVNNASLSSVEDSKKEDVNRCWNSDVSLPFGRSQALGSNSMTAIVHERSSDGPSLVLSETSQIFSTGNNVTGVFGSSVLENNLIRDSVNGLIFPNGNEQTSGIQNNLNRDYSSTMWEQPNTESAEKSRNNEPTTGLLNQSQSSGDSMAELVWRIDGQNVQQGGLADASPELMQSSDCYPNIDMWSGKEGADAALSVNEKFDTISGLEGPTPGRVEQLDYNSQSAQASSHSKESKLFSYGGEMEQDFSSSAWLEKESLPSMPNIAGKPEITICVWCQNEFYHEAYEAGTQTDSVCFVCATCQAKFSSQFDYL